MQEPPGAKFEDPALKAALRRALPQERAPEPLRQRIAALAGGKRSGVGAKSTSIGIFRQNWFRLAAAIVLLVGLGGSAALVYLKKRPGAGQTQYVIPNTLYKAMVATHEARRDNAAAPDTITTLAEATKLSQTLSRGVFAPDLSKDGWTFAGGAVRSVGTHSVAQLFYTKGKASVSVLSLPAAAATNAPEGSTYDIVFSGTPIAGYVQQGGLFCIVGQSEDKSLTIEQVKELLAKHRGQLVKA